MLRPADLPRRLWVQTRNSTQLQLQLPPTSSVYAANKGVQGYVGQLLTVSAGSLYTWEPIQMFYANAHSRMMYKKLPSTEDSAQVCHISCVPVTQVSARHCSRPSRRQMASGRKMCRSYRGMYVALQLTYLLRLGKCYRLALMPCVAGTENSRLGLCHPWGGQCPSRSPRARHSTGIPTCSEPGVGRAQAVRRQLQACSM